MTIVVNPWCRVHQAQPTTRVGRCLRRRAESCSNGANTYESNGYALQARASGTPHVVRGCGDFIQLFDKESMMKPALKLGLASGLLVALLGGCATVPGERDAFYRGEVYVRPSDSYYRSYNDRDYR